MDSLFEDALQFNIRLTTTTFNRLQTACCFEMLDTIRFSLKIALKMCLQLMRFDFLFGVNINLAE